LCSADAQVIIWAQKPEGYAGILKYNHNEAIQCLAYNPVTQQLASCTASDFGMIYLESNHSPIVLRFMVS
jgi:intraflagellar transport protein 122